MVQQRKEAGVTKELAGFLNTVRHGTDSQQLEDQTRRPDVEICRART